MSLVLGAFAGVNGVCPNLGCCVQNKHKNENKSCAGPSTESPGGVQAACSSPGRSVSRAGGR